MRFRYFNIRHDDIGNVHGYVRLRHIDRRNLYIGNSPKNLVFGYLGVDGYVAENRPERVNNSRPHALDEVLIALAFSERCV